MGIELVGFIAVVVLAYLIPGPDFLLVSRYAVQEKRLGLAAALGAQSGLCVHMLVAALGLSAIAAQSAEFFMIVRWLGAAYLVWMGITVLRQGRHHTASSDVQSEKVQSEQVLNGHRRAFANGFLTNLLNPKAIVFFLSVLPQFMDPAGDAVRQILMLGVLDVAIGVVWWWGVVAVMQQVANVLKRPRVRQWWNRITGGLMIGAGALLARHGTG
ncbi:LysE family translocator [Kushneria indalinina]|uniref:RhtB (Resistance to homoserine/threonine) family protein n=1 Tax=Kushneria indalinina DSM 14324 TaxID=1122140 RepID=A0A3D9E059_9GAMM|nr:LysE family translocator [Kushneria indalinina]REC96433.1 RhtB (resistance to homoserine/threonine) family protein [Kushneria indalinina DSM 14324]